MVEVVVGMLGFGVVGGGTVKLLQNARGLRFKKILVRELGKKRSISTPHGCQLTTNIHEILDDSEINLIIEVMGGTELAWTATRHALTHGKHVTSANKALISKYMTEIVDILKNHPTVMFMFEAAVCGGIPIVAAMQRSMICDDVLAIKGIMNGTTNFMLTKMIKEASSYDEALRDAKERGYAEADPSADVLGWDARSKLCILSKIAWGCNVDENCMYTDGIGSITPYDVKCSKQAGRCIRLLGIAEKAGSKVYVSCSPVLVPIDSTLGSIEGVTNAVQVRSQNLDVATFIGPGAGELPSANSVVNDVLSMLRHFNQPSSALPPFRPTSDVVLVDPDFEAQFYLRTFVQDPSSARPIITKQLETRGIKIKEFLPAVPGEEAGIALVTERCHLNEIKKGCEALENSSSRTIFLRFDD